MSDIPTSVQCSIAFSFYLACGAMIWLLKVQNGFDDAYIQVQIDDMDEKTTRLLVGAFSTIAWMPILILFAISSLLVWFAEIAKPTIDSK